MILDLRYCTYIIPIPRVLIHDLRVFIRTTNNLAFRQANGKQLVFIKDIALLAKNLKPWRTLKVNSKIITFSNIGLE